MKQSKDVVDYEHPASKPQNHCGVCRHFDAPAACSKVAGRIRPEDWCRLFDRRKIVAWSKWIDLAFDDEEMADRAAPSMPTPPEYPYGCRICLTTRELEMAQLPTPKRGDQIDLRAFAEVKAIREDGTVELQIQRMKVENEDSEDERDEDD